MNTEDGSVRPEQAGPLRRFEEALGGRVVKSGLAHCPAHDDTSPSLSFKQSGGGTVLVHCHAGCEPSSIVEAIGLTLADLFEASAAPSGLENVEYLYADEDGVPLYTVVRTPGKKFFHRPANGKVGTGAMHGVRRVPYRLQCLLDAIAVGETVYIVEGEKDCDALLAVGEIATTNSGGAKKWLPEFAQYFEGADVVIVADRDDVGAAHAEFVRTALVGVVRSVRVVEARKGKDAADHLAAGYGVSDFVERAGPVLANRDRRLTLTSAADVPMAAARWLWEATPGLQLIPMGELALVQGFEGTGKSTVVLALAAAVTRGTLHGEMYGEPRSVIVVATEDSPAHTIVPRLQAAGADLHRVFFVNVSDESRHDDLLVFPSDLGALEQQIRENDVVLVILDPLIARLGRLDSHKDAEVRQALEPLVRVANNTGASIVGLMHYNKTNVSDRRNRTMGSRAFPAVARAILDVTEDPDDPSLRLLSLSKSNLGPSPLPSLRYRLVGCDVGVDQADGRSVIAVKVEWDGLDPRTIDDLFAVATGPSVTSALDAATTWLRELLSDGDERPSRGVKELGRTAGHSGASIARARDRLGVDVRSEGMPRQTFWKSHMNPDLGIRNDDATETTVVRESSLARAAYQSSLLHQEDETESTREPLGSSPPMFDIGDAVGGG